MVFGRRAVAALLSAALILTSPGLGCYEAVAAQVAGRVGRVPAGTLGASFKAGITPELGASFGLSAGLKPAVSLAGGSVLPSSVLTPVSEPARLSAAAVSPTSGVSELVAQAVSQLSQPGVSRETLHMTGLKLSGVESRWNGGVSGPVVSVQGSFVRGQGLRAGKASGSYKYASSIGEEPARTGARRGLGAWVRKTVAAAMLTLAVFLPGWTALRAQEVYQPAQTTTTGTRAKPIAGPVSAEVSIDKQGVTVGDRVNITLILHNNALTQVTLTSLRASLQLALGANLEIQGPGGDEPLKLAPGETKTVAFEVLPFVSGDIALTGTVVSIPVEGLAEPATNIILPEAVLKVETVLTPDWREKMFRGPDDELLNGTTSDLDWLAAIPLALLLLVGVERMVAARRNYKKASAGQLPLLVKLEGRLSVLDEAIATDARFYAEFYGILDTFLVDYHGLPTKERDAAQLIADMEASGKLTAEQLAAASDLASRAQAIRFGTSTVDPQRRKDDLAALRRLIAGVTGGTPQAGPIHSDGHGLKALALLGFVPAAAGLSFSQPWALLLFIPFAGWLLWKRLHRKSSAFTVPSSKALPRAKSWRQRFANLPRALRLSAIGLIILALAGPQRGIERKTNYTPSTDTMIALDVSGSMDGASDALGTSKKDAAIKAVTGFVDEQRRGTENRVGMITFDDKAYVDMRLTTDYDAFISHLKELRSGGGTAVGEAILSSIGHFVEINILELNDAADPRFAKVRQVLLDEGLTAALEYAKNDRDLMDKIVRPDRQKVVVLFTDGMSNDGVDPMEAASIAAGLGVRVYTVGIQADEDGLRDIAAATGAKYYRADDAAQMRAVLLEISQLEKSPSQVLSTVSTKSYQGWLVALALLALGFEVVLGSTRLRSLSAALLLGAAVPLANLQQVSVSQSVATTQTMTASSWRLSDLLPLDHIPPEMAEGNKLYAQGRYDEALKAYGRAVALYPDAPEVYFNMGSAYLRVGEPTKAQECWKKFAELTQDPKLAAKAYYNHGVAAILLQDAKTALEDFKQALRLDSGNADAKWNLEVLNKLIEEQRQQQQQQGQPGEKGEKGQPSDQQSQDKSQQGQPSDQQGKDAAEKLRQKLKDQENKEKNDAPNGPSRSGDSSQWGLLAAPLAAALGGTAFSFSSPAFLWALGIGVPVVLGLLAYGIVKKIKAAKKLSPATAPSSFRDWWGKRRFVRKAALIGAAVSLLSIAASGPSSGTRDERLNFGGKDILVAVDGSQSMVYAEDGRFDKTRDELIAFAEKLQGTDRVGLVVFAGDARTASPVSIDYANFEYKVNRLEIEARSLEPGSHLYWAIEQAARSFKAVKKIDGRPQILIVISDGDIPDGEVKLAIETAKKNGITVYTIGVGGPVGSRMKVPDGKGGTQYVTDDHTGGPAVTRLNESTLKQISAETGGAYFPGGDGSSIESVLARVAELEKGQKEDAVRSPRPIGSYFLWPALLLLLLDLATPGASVLKKEKQSPKKEDKGSPTVTKLGGFAFLGALPLSAWPQLLPFAVIFTVVASILLANVWTRGALSRGLRWAWGRRLKVVAKGLDADREALFDVREIDHERLAAFHQAWKSSDEPGKRALTAEALEDAQLWRQKLALAFLTGSSPETEETLAAAARAGAKRYLGSLDPVVAHIAGQRAKLPWLQHIDAAARLARLAALGLDADNPESRALLTELAKFPDIRVSIPAQEALGTPPPAARRSWPRRIALALAGSVLAGALFFTGLAGVRTAQYSERQAEATESSAQTFFGEDNFIFGDTYVDERIPQYVLPALRDWSRDDARSREDMDRAISVLLSSPDPKVNNLIEVVFKHADYLALSEPSETALLKAIAVSEDAHLWGVVEQELPKTGYSQKTAERYAKLVVHGVDARTQAAYGNLWRILKSPNAQLRSFAYSKLYAVIADTTLGYKLPLSLLGSVQQAYPTDPVIALWVERALLQRIAEPDGAVFKFGYVRTVMLRSLTVAYQADQQRPQALAQGATLPPSYVEQAVSLLVSAEETAKARGTIPVPLTQLAKFSVKALADALIGEGEQLFPALHQKLVDLEVVLPDASSYDDVMSISYEEDEGTRFHESYRLRHLEDLRAALREEGAAAPDSLIQKKEYAARADSILTKLIDAGEKAGITRDITIAERASEALQVVLDVDGDLDEFSQADLLAILAPAGLAGPSYGGGSIFKDGYTREELLRIGAALETSARDNASWSFEQKLQLVRAAEGVETLARKFYPVKGVTATLSEKEFFQRLDAPGQEKLILARASVELGKHLDDGVFQMRLYKRVLLLAAGPQGKLMKTEELQEYLGLALVLFEQSEQGVASWKLLAEAVKGQPKDGLLAVTAREMSQTSAGLLIFSAENAFPAFDSLAKREHLERRDYKVSTMKRALDAFEKTAGKLDPKALSAGQKNTLKMFRAYMPILITIAERSGVAPTETAGEYVGAAVNAALQRANWYFAGPGLQVELQMAGLADSIPQRGTIEEAYFRSYTRQQLVDMRALFQKIVDRGSIHFEPGGTLWGLAKDEVPALKELIAELDAQIKAYPAPGTLYGFAPLLILAAPVSLTTLLAVGALLAGLWLAWRWLLREPRQAPNSERPQSALERYRKLDFAARRLASSAASGGFRSLFVGRNGTEFAETKAFEDEELREIDWKTTAKTGELQVQRFEEEKDMPLMLLVDMSRSSEFGTSGLDKKTVIAEAAAVLALAASLRNLRVGAVFFTDKIERYVAPRSGRRNAQELMKELLEFEPKGSGTDLNGPIARVLGGLKSRALVAVVSDFLAPDFAAKLAALAQKHDVRAIQVSDPVELKPLPDVGLLKVRDAETGEERLVDTSNGAFRAQQAGLAARGKLLLQEAFDKARIKPLMLSTDGEHLETLYREFQPKKQAKGA